MSGLILCSDRSVTHPYYVAELGLQLYSAEELSYFVYHNALLINEDFLNDQLYEFLEELGQQRLLERVRRLRDQLGLYDILYVLLQELRFYSSAELFTFRKQLEQLSEIPPGERLKRKGDYFFDREQYYSALRIYDQSLTQEGSGADDAELVGTLWHNKGSCYARLENYEAALRCYTRAYEILRESATLETIYGLTRLCPSLRPAAEIQELIEENEACYSSNFEERAKLALYRGKALEAAALEDKPAKERGDAYLTLLHDWKEEYRRNQV